MQRTAASPFYQPVVAALRADPQDEELQAVLDFCRAVEAEDGPAISLLAGTLVKKVSPRTPPVEDIPSAVFYEAMARLLMMGECAVLERVLEWYRRLSILSRSREDEITENWEGAFDFIDEPPPPGLDQRELGRRLERVRRALECVLAAWAPAEAAAGPPKPPPPIGPETALEAGVTFGTVRFGRPSRLSVLGDGIEKLVRAWMGIHQQLLELALEHLASKAKDRGAKLAALRLVWEHTLRRTFRREAAQKSPRLPALPIKLTNIRYGRRSNHLYLDAFPPHDARTFGFTDYDREAEEPPGKRVRLDDLVRYREAQLAFLLDEYGEFHEDIPATATAAERLEQAARRKRYAERRTLIDRVEERADSLRLESEDDLVSFGCAFHEVLTATGAVRRQSNGLSPAEERRRAWGTLLEFLQRYLRTQTHHARYNLHEEPTYFDRHFPRALNGGALFDCGVYAVRLAFVFLSWAECVGRGLEDPKPPKVSFILFPLHVGLIVELPDFPPFVVHNHVLSWLTDDQEKEWRKEWDKKSSLDPRADPADTGKRRQKFLEDFAAQLYIRDTDLPLMRRPITGVSSPPKKYEIFRIYRRISGPRAPRMFAPRIENPSHRDFQFDLRFLRVLDLERSWYDEAVVPFWNQACRATWEKVAPNGNPKTVLAKSAARRKAYADDLEKLIAAAEGVYDREVRPPKEELSKDLRAKPDILGRKVDRVTASGRLKGSATGIGPIGEVRAHIDDIRQGTVNVPRFAHEAQALTRVGR